MYDADFPAQGIASDPGNQQSGDVRSHHRHSGRLAQPAGSGGIIDVTADGRTGAGANEDQGLRQLEAQV